MKAARFGNIDVVNLMIEKGANPRVKNKDKESAIHISARSYSFNIFDTTLNK